MGVLPRSWDAITPWTETRGWCGHMLQHVVGMWLLITRYERTKIAFEGLTQGIGEKTALDQLIKVRYKVLTRLVHLCHVTLCHVTLHHSSS